MKTTCLVWDFDNTLAKRKGMWTKSLCNVLENNDYITYDISKISNSFKTGFPWHRYEEAHKDYIINEDWWGYVNSLVKSALEALEILTDNEVLNITKQFRKEYLRISAWSLFDDTIQNLEYSKELGFSNIILSNHTPELELLVASLGIEKYFDGIITSAKVGYDKPNKNIFDYLRTNFKYDKYIMIGDSYQADILGGNKAGFTSILVRKNNINDYSKYALDLHGIWRYIVRK